MGAVATRKSATIARLVKTLTIKVDGEDLHVPVGKAENKMMNCIMVSQVRRMVQDNMKKIKDLEQAISPKELKDLVDAVGRLAESSAEVYKDLDGELDEKEPKPADKMNDAEPIEADFSTITQQNDHTSSGTITSPAAPAPSGAPDGE